MHKAVPHAALFASLLVSLFEFSSPLLTSSFGPKTHCIPISHYTSSFLESRLNMRQSRQSLTRSASVLDKMFKDLSSGIREILGGDNSNGIMDLRGALGEAEFSAVKSTISKLMAKQRDEIRDLQIKNLDQQKQLQKELNEYSNKVRDLEFQLILAATEVTDLEEQISELKSGGQSAPTLRPQSASVETVDHPVFGRFLADFGYKKVFAADPAKLYAATPIYKKQRTFRTERAASIARAKAASAVAGWPGTITVVEFGGEGAECVLVDGQHRLGAYSLLARQLAAANKSRVQGMDEMLVEVYPGLDDSQAAEVFTEINKAEPCKLIDLPSAHVNPAVKAIIDGAAEALRRKYSDMFKPSAQCRTPHMNIDNLRDQLFQAEIVVRGGFKTEADLLGWMEHRNAALAEIPDEEWVPRQRTRIGSLPKALAKARAQAMTSNNTCTLVYCLHAGVLPRSGMGLVGRPRSPSCRPASFRSHWRNVILPICLPCGFSWISFCPSCASSSFLPSSSSFPSSALCRCYSNWIRNLILGALTSRLLSCSVDIEAAVWFDHLHPRPSRAFDLQVVAIFAVGG
mmetsp:Transcript_49752/g.130848  ORF Transcript_49752/g.130848 Transcript_49752/m.130848 type:complete len:572 (-) Transcript_49752:236-1951(-)